MWAFGIYPNNPQPCLLLPKDWPMTPKPVTGLFLRNLAWLWQLPGKELSLFSPFTFGISSSKPISSFKGKFNQTWSKSSYTANHVYGHLPMTLRPPGESLKSLWGLLTPLWVRNVFILPRSKDLLFKVTLPHCVTRNMGCSWCKQMARARPARSPVSFSQRCFLWMVVPSEAISCHVNFCPANHISYLSSSGS